MEPTITGLDKVEDLIPRAEIFRSKLIEDFHLLDSINKSSMEVPKYYSSELSDSAADMANMLKECPHAVVKFQVYNSKVETTYEDRRLNRVKTKNTIPFGPWAKMVVENQSFQNFMLFLILVNSVVLGIQAEISEMKDESILGMKLVLDIFDYISLIVFILEILLKWVDGFWEFWKNGWNNFDFFVTVMSLLPELIKLVSGEINTQSLAVIGENLRVFRILRSLKMVSRFAQLRIIVLTILKAFKSMIFILTLLAVFMYIFAVAGTVVFDSLEDSVEDIAYKYSFSNLGQSLATLFQLFTLDHWFDVLTDMQKVSNGLISKIYIILWICIGAFIFRNIFAGIMVMNFQNIRADFATQCQDKENELEEESREKLLEMELAMQYVRQPSMKIHVTSSNEKSLPQMNQPTFENGESSSFDDGNSATCDVKMAKDSNIDVNKNAAAPANEIYQDLKKLSSRLSGSISRENKDDSSESAGWNNAVRMNLNNLANSHKETLWPRDTLFRYFQLMEALQDNLVERNQLQRVAALALCNLHDSSPTQNK